MSRGARLTILGLYNYNSDIFQGFNVPEGMDRETVLNEILLQCGNLELVYPTYNILKLAITNWSRVEMPIWTKLYNTENFDYNPIWNVDGTVTEIGNTTGSGTTTNNSTRTGSTKGYSETNWLENEKDVLNGSEGTSNEVNDTRTTTRTGNIGVTTTQSMIKEERDVDTFSTIKYIVDSFKKRFCIMIY
jgi:hypothetical protein